MLFLSILADFMDLVKRGEDMEYEVVKQWLDELVDDFLKVTKENVLNSTIRAQIAIEVSVLIYEGIDIVADVMGFDLTEEILNNDCEVWFAYSFTYKGVKFVEYKSKRLAVYGD